MTTVMTWDNKEKTIYRVEYNEGWTWDDYVTVTKASHEEIAAIGHTIDLIVCFNARMPPGNAMPHITYSGRSQPDNVYRTVFINKTGRQLTSVLDMINRSYGWVGPDIFETLEEARAFLSNPLED